MFVVTIAIVEAALSQAQQAPPPEPPPTVLVVEDEVLIRLAVADYLRECGWRVLEAGSAAEAIQVLQASDIAVDVVFTDVQMPGDLDGFGLARWVCVNQPDVRVLLTSGGPASVAAKAGDLCEDAHPDRSSVLRKPYDHREVTRRIEAMLGRAARAN